MILADAAPGIRPLAERLRSLVRETVPEAIETPYPGWHAIGYRHPESGYFAGIFPETGRVRLAFEWGVLLPDPLGLLGGTGKQVRYVDVYDGGELRETVIRDLLLAAASLPADRSIKLALVRQSAKPS